jgi:undecaprenyl diphosphate synthase
LAPCERSNFASEYFMLQSYLHVAIIMDGNGRWAGARCLPRALGHRAGVQAARSIIEAAPSFGIGTLTLYAFSADNWRRPAAEVNALMLLFCEFLTAETTRCRQQGVRLSIIGRRDRLQPALVRQIELAEADTIGGANLHLRVALDYSGREAIANGSVGPDVDLLIRSGGEHRLSDFLLWESAYAELYFTPCLWPDFRPSDLAAAVREFSQRDRRYGGLGELETQHAGTGNIHHIRGDRWLR